MNEILDEVIELDEQGDRNIQLIGMGRMKEVYKFLQEYIFTVMKQGSSGRPRRLFFLNSLLAQFPLQIHWLFCKVFYLGDR